MVSILSRAIGDFPTEHITTAALAKVSKTLNSSLAAFSLLVYKYSEIHPLKVDANVHITNRLCRNKVNAEDTRWNNCKKSTTLTSLTNLIFRPVICLQTNDEPVESVSIEIPIGTVLSPDDSELEVKELLGSGAFGKVFSVTERHTGRVMAMKVLHNETEEQKQNNEAEIAVLERLSTERRVYQSYLPDYYGNFVFEDYLCILMEQLDCSLLDHMEQQTEPPSVATCVYLAHQILLALNELNEAGYGHTDLKLNNVMFVKPNSWRVKLIDFGLAPNLTDMRRSYNYGECGTLPYQAPEVTFELDCDEKVDIWSLGCLFFEVYTGMDLFTADDKPVLIRQLDHLLGLPANIDASYRFDRFFRSIDDEETPILLVSSIEFSDPTDEMPYKHRRLKKMIQYGLNMRKDGIARSEDVQFMQFVCCLLQLDKEKRPNAKQALQHNIFNRLQH